MASAASSWPTTRWHIAYQNHANASTFFVGVTATGPAAAWVLGQTGSTFFVLQWNGRTWQRMKPLPANIIAGPITASGPANVWVFASTTGSAGSEALHWDGTSWTTIPMPDVPTSYAVAVSPTEVWVASDANELLRWDGTVWKSSPYQFPSWQPLTAAGGHVWRVDSGRVGGRANRLIIRTWNGGHWQAISSPHPFLGNGGADISASSPHNIWVQIPISGGYDRAYMLHWNGETWSRLARPANLSEPFGFIAAVGRSGAWVGGGQARWTAGRWVIWPQTRTGCGAAETGEMTGVPRSESALCAETSATVAPWPATIWQAGPLP